jgi:hypothetical protein
MQKGTNKHALLLAVGLLLCAITTVNAQTAVDTGVRETSVDTAGKNLVKWNVAALALKNYSLQYERAVGKKIAIAIGVRYSPKSKAPMSSAIEDLVDNEETWEMIKDFKTGNFALTPEIRFYPGKKGVFRGFYVAPYVRYSNYSVDVPLNFTVEYAGQTRTAVIPLDGDITAFSGGLLFGAQWKLSKVVYLDWWILGFNYGSSSGNISGKRSLNPIEQGVLREKLSGLEDLPIVKSKVTVDAEGVDVDFDGPLPGARAGLSIGFRF